MASGKGPLRIAIEDFLDTFNISERIKGGIESLIEGPRDYIMGFAQPIIDDILATEGLPEKYKAPLREATSTDPITLGTVAVAILMALIVGTVMGIYAPVQRLIQYRVERSLHTARPDPAAAWAMGWRNLMILNAMRDKMRDQGWDEDMIDAWESVVKPRLSPAELIAYERRFGADPTATTDELVHRGYDRSEAQRMRELMTMIPAPQDLISMGVREAWRDDIAAKYGYDSDFPPEFAEWMQKQGDVDNWAQKYWRAHWRLPGLTTVLEAFHRLDDFDEGDLNDFLRVADIPSGWRDIIQRVSYRPLTRVDVRRMYAMGVLTKEDVLRSYLDLGYNQRNSELMTEFTVVFATEKDRELTKSDILGGFRDGVINATECAQYLMEINYPEDVAVYLVAREIVKIEKKQTDARIKYIKTLFVNQEITESDARTQLGALGQTSGQIEMLIDEWEVARTSKTKRPPQGTLDKFFLRDVITEAEFVAGLDGLGFSEKYVNWYLESILQQKTEDAAAEEDRTRDEQQAIRDRKVKSDYQIAKAAVDVDIAELNTAIADTQLAERARRNRYDQEIKLALEALTEAELEDQAKVDVLALELDLRLAQETIAGVRESIDLLQTQIKDVQLKSTPQPQAATAGEMAVAIREREVSISEFRAQIDEVQTEVAAVKLVMLEMEDAESIADAEILLAEYALYIETLQDSIATLRTEIEEIQVTQTIIVVEIEPEVAAVQIRDLRLAIELGQDNIAVATSEIAKTRSAILARKAQLHVDLRTIERMRAIDVIETEFLEDIAALTERLRELRANVALLRESKAVLTVEYRVEVA